MQLTFLLGGKSQAIRAFVLMNVTRKRREFLGQTMEKASDVQLLHSFIANLCLSKQCALPDLSPQQGASLLLPLCLWDQILEMVVPGREARATIRATVRESQAAHLTPTTLQGSKSLPSPSAPIVMLALNLAVFASSYRFAAT